MVEIVRTSKEDIQKYYDSPALNQSKLKKLQYGLDYYLKEDEDNKADYFVIGSALDCLLTHPEDFNDEFIVLDIEEPGDVVKTIISEIYKQRKELSVDWTLQQFKGSIETIIEMNGYFNPKWKMETKVNKVFEDGEKYYESLILSEGKTIISAKNNELIQTMYNAIQNTSACFPFCKEENYPANHVLKIEFQKPVYFEYKGIQCKALLDAYVETKTSDPLIFDLKTTSKRVLDFPESFFKFGYDMQLAWYQLSIGKPCKCYNVVESTSQPGQPCCYNISKEIVSDGTMKIDKLIDDILYYNEHGYDVERKIKENSNYLSITKEDAEKFSD